jgi:hypothetical protein
MHLQTFLTAQWSSHLGALWGMQLYEYGTSWGVLAFVRDAVASNSALLLLHCTSQLATFSSHISHEYEFSSISSMALLHCASH